MNYKAYPMALQGGNQKSKFLGPPEQMPGMGGIGQMPGIGSQPMVGGPMPLQQPGMGGQNYVGRAPRLIPPGGGRRGRRGGGQDPRSDLHMRMRAML